MWENGLEGKHNFIPFKVGLLVLFYLPLFDCEKTVSENVAKFLLELRVRLLFSYDTMIWTG